MDNWTENVIIADGDYIDRVAFNLIVNFERMLGRRIPQADTARWAECIALDGGLREGSHETTVVLIHDTAKKQMENFAPGNYTDELNGKAFQGRLGEFCFTAVSTEGLATKESLFADTLQLTLQQKDVKRLMVIPDEANYDRIRQALRQADDEKRITMFAMQPMPGGNFRQEILGYSLMAALGIKGSEIENKTTETTKTT
ncbi:MAG: hypothetical protein J6Z14_07960 [Prevotella sp.]|nr:hypothetical protein [Prevotella sp.]